MKLVVGLGNPERRYKNTRHNLGFIFADYLADTIHASWNESKKDKAFYAWVDLDDQKVELLKPLTYMNDSGVSVSYAKRKYGLKNSDIYVVHDDLDLKLGEYKIQLGVGPKVHNGVNSIEEKLGAKDFWRIRVGIDNRESTNRISGEDYVLQNFSSDEMEIVNKVIEEICKKFPTF